MSESVTRVDLENLENAARQLDQIKQFLESRCLGYMPAISESLGSASNVDMSDTEYQFTREATVFGAFYSAYGMQARNDSVYRSMQSSLRQLITHVETTAQNVRTIIGNYQSAEDENVQSGHSLENVVNSPPANSPGSGTMYA